MAGTHGCKQAVKVSLPSFFRCFGARSPCRLVASLMTCRPPIRFVSSGKEARYQSEQSETNQVPR